MPKSHFFAIVVLSIVVCSQLFRPGLFTSPDGENHLVRLAWFSRYLSQGHLYPRWIAELNHGQGLPLFTFIYPLPYYLASIPVLVGWPLVASLKLILLLATLVSAMGMYAWLSTFCSRPRALLAAGLFLFTPYRFLDLYVRLGFGELVFIALVPWLFYALESTRGRLAAFTLAAMAIAHLQLTAVFLPLVAVYALARRIAWISSVVGGLLLSAFFWLPALALQSATFFSTLHQFPPSEHLPTLRQLIYSSWGFGFSLPGAADGMSFQMGLANWAVLIIATANLFRLPRFGKWSVGACWLAILFMVSSPFGFWSWPLTQAVQFPWRLLVIPLVLTPVLLTSIRPRLLLLLLLLLAVYSNRNHIRVNLPQFVDTPDEYFYQTHKTTTATPKELMPVVYGPATLSLFSSSPVIRLATALSIIAAGTIGLWPRLQRP